MPWWGKSTEEGKRKTRKGCVVDTSHGKLRIVSEEKGGSPGTSRRRYLDIVSENAVNSGVYNRHPSRSFSEKSSAEPVQFQGGQPSATLVVRSKIDISIRTSCESVCWLSVLGSLYEPGHTVDTQDGKYIVMEFKTASVLEGNKRLPQMVTNCSTSLKPKDNKSAIASKKNSTEMPRPSSLLLNNQGVSLSPKRQPRGSNVLNIQISSVSASVSAPNSSLSSHLATPKKAIHHEPLRNYEFVPGNLYTKACLPDSWKLARTKLAPEPPITLSSDKNKQSYRLPLPPVVTSSSVSMLPSSYTSTNSHFLQSSVQADDLPSPGPQFKKGRIIGSGTFGRVYLGFNNESGDMCAMKEVTIFSDDPKSEEGAHQLGQEIELLSQLHHPNIVQYYGSEKVDENVYIYLEYVPGGSIHKVLKDYGPLGESALRSFTKQILSGLQYLHAKNTVHRDVKGANILLQPGGFVKLADFGMAKHITGQIAPMSFKGSPHWIAPEVISHSNADVSVDIWSLGCTVLEMATGEPPWGQYEGVAALFKIINSEELPFIPDSLPEEGKDFIRKCLQRDPSKRPTAAELLEHPFVKCSIPLERLDPYHEPVEEMHLVANTGNPKDTPCLVSPVGELLLPESQPQPTRSTPSVGPDAGEVQFHHPRTPHHTSERFSLTSVETPYGAPSSSTRLTAGNVKPRYEMWSSSPISSSLDASGSSPHLPGGNMSLRFSKSPTRNRHRDPVSIVRPHTSSYGSVNTSYEDARPDMLQPIPQAPRIPQMIDIHSSIKRDQVGSNVRGHTSELANWVPLQQLGKHVKFDLP